MNELEVIKMDNRTYTVLADLIIDNSKYYLLVDNITKEYMIRKEENDELVGLTEEEFNKVLPPFVERMEEYV